MALDNSRKLRVTRHASERAEEFGISMNKLVWMFWKSEKEPTPPNAKNHSDRKEVTIFRRNGTVVMVAGECNDKITGLPIYLLITAYDQKLDSPYP